MGLKIVMQNKILDAGYQGKVLNSIADEPNCENGLLQKKISGCVESDELCLRITPNHFHLHITSQGLVSR
jgi:hypothetical protein